MSEARKIEHLTNEPPVDTLGAAKFIGVSPGTLQNWRWKRKGPRYISRKACGRVLYRMEDLREWLAQNLIDPENR